LAQSGSGILAFSDAIRFTPGIKQIIAMVETSRIFIETELNPIYPIGFSDRRSAINSEGNRKSPIVWEICRTLTLISPWELFVSTWAKSSMLNEPKNMALANDPISKKVKKPIAASKKSRNIVLPGLLSLKIPVSIRLFFCQR
jgi:hypothetical protein